MLGVSLGLSLFSGFASPRPALADNQILLWPDGTTFTRFGPNTQVIIDIGAIAFVPDCPPPGIPDRFFAASDLYVVPSGSVKPGSIGTALSDVSGRPHTVVSGALGGLFLGEQIGITAPSGKIGPGRYAVVYNECQDGKLGPHDAVFDPAFEVVIGDPKIPPLPSLAALKADAAAQERSWLNASVAMFGLFVAAVVAEAIGALTDPFHLVILVVNFSAGIISGIHIEEAVIAATLNMARHYRALANDPPDPNFTQPTPLGARQAFDTGSNDPLLTAGRSLGSAASNHDALVLALTTSIERYQGASAAGDGHWALVHARAVRQYADLLAAQLASVDASAAAFNTALASDARPLDATAAQVITFRDRLATSGFTAAEQLAAGSLGLSPTQLEKIRSDFVARDFSFSKAQLSAALTALQAADASTLRDLQALSLKMEPVIAALSADPLATGDTPSATLGGPYSGAAGSAIAFRATVIASRSPVTRFEWDFTGDSLFKDATGPTPSFTFPRPLQGLVGLRVTNAAAQSTVSYAQLTVTGGRRPPTVAALSPSPQQAQVVAGGSQTFSVSASQPDGDAVSIEWFLDSRSVATGPAFTFKTASGDVGLHSVDAVVTGAGPLGRSVQLKWLVAVLSAPVLTPSALTWSGDTSADFNDPTTLAATLVDATTRAPIAGARLALAVGSQNCAATTGFDGRGSCVITLNQIPGPYTATASFAGDAHFVSSRASRTFSITREETALTYAGDTTADFHDPATLSAILVDPADRSATPISGKTLTLTLGAGQSCTAVTDAGGRASCVIIPEQAAGTVTLTTSFGGDAFFLPTITTRAFVITREETALTYTGDQLIANGPSATLAGVLKEDGLVPIPARTVRLQLGSGTTAQSCSGTTNASGQASCTIPVVAQPLGPGTVTASFAGDTFYRSSSDTGATLLFEYLGSGSFVIGDRNVSLGGSVTFWAAQWAHANSLTGGPATDSFKGFASAPSSQPPLCGRTWNARPGNSGHPPDSLPTYMAVIVSSSVSKSGATILGNTPEIVVVKTNPGYAPNPGHPGTGTIVASPSNAAAPAVICHK